MNIYTPFEAFVYYWQNSQNNKIYLGVHKGILTDGYTHSSRNKKFRKEFEEHPEHFARTIVAYGTWKDMLELEANILHFVNARKNPMYYNRSNGGSIFVYDPSIPCIWEGNEYPSMKATAIAIGINNQRTISRWIQKGYTSMADAEKGTAEGYRKAGLSNQRPFTWEGIGYPSMSAAARALGVARSTLQRWFQQSTLFERL